MMHKASVKTARFLPGALVDRRFEVIRLLGSGAMADVYLCRDGADHALVALKVVQSEFAEECKSAHERFEREIFVIRQLRPSPFNLHLVARGCDDDGRHYYVTNYVPGIGGHEVIRHLRRSARSLPAAQVARLVADVAYGLAELHRLGFVHRDVKPENTFVNEATGIAVLGDYGTARSETDHDRARQITDAGCAVGTLAAMAPEQLFGHAVGASDCYAVGVLLYVFATSRFPFSGKLDSTQLFHAIREGEFAPPSTLRSDGDARFDGLTRRLLAFDLRERASLKEVIDSLVSPEDEACYARTRAEIRTLIIDAKGETSDETVVAGTVVAIDPWGFSLPQPRLAAATAFESAPTIAAAFESTPTVIGRKTPPVVLSETLVAGIADGARRVQERSRASYIDEEGEARSEPGGRGVRHVRIGFAMSTVVALVLLVAVATFFATTLLVR